MANLRLELARRGRPAARRPRPGAARAARLPEAAAPGSGGKLEALAVDRGEQLRAARQPRPPVVVGKPSERRERGRNPRLQLLDGELDVRRAVGRGDRRLGVNALGHVNATQFSTTAPWPPLISQAGDYLRCLAWNPRSTRIVTVCPVWACWRSATRSPTAAESSNGASRSSPGRYGWRGASAAVHRIRGRRRPRRGLVDGSFRPSSGSPPIPAARYDLGCLYIGVNDVRAMDWDAAGFEARFVVRCGSSPAGVSAC